MRVGICILAASIAYGTIHAAQPAPQSLGGAVAEIFDNISASDIKAIADGAARALGSLNLKSVTGDGLQFSFDLADADVDAFFTSLADIVKIVQNASAREQEYRRKLARDGYAELPLSTAACRFEISIGATRLKFDKWGELFIDRRFLTSGEKERLRRTENLYRKIMDGSPQVRKSGEKILSRAEAEKGLAVPVFRGFEDDRYQKHDKLIAAIAKAFNADKAKWIGGTAEQAAKVPDLTPAIVKAQMIEETGGGGAVSRAAWECDPMQVNVPGDWDDSKALIGLVKPAKRNEGTLKRNLCAGVQWLSRKGFGVSGKPARVRNAGFFDGWQVALRRYNARRVKTADGRFFDEAYAEKILRRASNPDEFVPIEVRTAAPAKK
ncbi:MAG: hypothetical protein IJ802_01320 [Kiritimatiellae bacterium]|nr:hypothetical protein [Kiritimatiellia bacterium]